MIAQTFGPAMDKLMQMLKGRTMQEFRARELQFVSNIVSVKGPLAKYIVRSPWFKTPQQSFGNPPKELNMGFALQSQTLLGFMLAPTPMDTAIFGTNSARFINFKQPRNYNAYKARAQMMTSLRQIMNVEEILTYRTSS